MDNFVATFYRSSQETTLYWVSIVVDHVDYLIAYAWQPGSNAKELVMYAYKRGKVTISDLRDMLHAK